MTQIVEAVRSLVRPVVTLAVLGAYIAAAFLDVEAAGLLKEITLVAVSFWFGQRVANGGSS